MRDPVLSETMCFVGCVTSYSKLGGMLSAIKEKVTVRAGQIKRHANSGFLRL